MKQILLGIFIFAGGAAHARIMLLPPAPMACSQMILNEAKQIEGWTHANFVNDIKGDKLVLKKANGSGGVSWNQSSESQTIDFKFSGDENDPSSSDPNEMTSARWKVEKSGDGYTFTNTQLDSSGKPYHTTTRHYKATNGQCALDQGTDELGDQDIRKITYDQILCDRINQFVNANSKKIEECQDMMNAVDKIVRDRQAEISKSGVKDKKTVLAMIKMSPADRNPLTYGVELSQDCSGTALAMAFKNTNSSSSAKGKASSATSGTH